MKIEFDQIPVKVIPNFNGGEKSFDARMFIDSDNKILLGKLTCGASIGMHKHETSSEVIYVLSGSGRMLIDDTEEVLKAGDCHYCPKGHSHSLINNGTEELLFFAVVPQQ